MNALQRLASALDGSSTPQLTNHAGPASGPSRVPLSDSLSGIAPENCPHRFREVMAAASAGDPEFAEGSPYDSTKPIPALTEILEWSRRHRVRPPDDDEIRTGRARHREHVEGEKALSRFDPRRLLRSKAEAARRTLAELEDAERQAAEHGRLVLRMREEVESRREGLALAQDKLLATRDTIAGMKAATANYATASFPSTVSQMIGPLSELICSERWADDLVKIHLPRLERELAEAEAELAKLE